MKEPLKLTQKQETQLLDLFKKQSEEMSKMFKDGEHPDREAMESFRNKQNEAVKKILTEEQYKTYSEQMQHRGRHGHGPGGHGPRGNN